MKKLNNAHKVTKALSSINNNHNRNIETLKINCLNNKFLLNSLKWKFNEKSSLENGVLSEWRQSDTAQPDNKVVFL